MSAYITRYCKTHGEWDDDVDNPSECPICIELGLTEVQQLRTANAELVAALEELFAASDDGKFEGEALHRIAAAHTRTQKILAKVKDA